MMNKIVEDYSDKRIGIYIHIPFCVKKCAYCDFLSGPADEATKSDYVDALIEEIRQNSCIDSVATIFFGGGTPSTLNPLLIEDIMTALRQNFNILDEAEVTIECNPGTVSVGKLMAYKSVGINRISFGLQSADNTELHAIGRIHTYESFIESYECARRAGFDNINIDLISALPNQTIASWRNTLEKVLRLEPQHISAYSLILEEGTPLYRAIEAERQQGIDRIPCEEFERKMYYLTEEMLERAGYEHYEISNYAKPGYECQHNLSYWEPSFYLGFGIGAASYYNNVRYKNIDDIRKYIAHSSEKELIRTDITPLTLHNRMEEFMFLGLRKIHGVLKSDFLQRFGVSYDSVYGKITSKFLEEGLLVVHEDRVFLTARGIDISNSVMSEFLFDD